MRSAISGVCVAKKLTLDKEKDTHTTHVHTCAHKHIHIHKKHTHTRTLSEETIMRNLQQKKMYFLTPTARGVCSSLHLIWNENLNIII